MTSLRGEMINKNEYRYVEMRVNDLKLKLADYEANSAVYAMWKKWENLTPEDKSKLREEWKKYYAGVLDSYHGKIFQKSWRAFRDWVATGSEEKKAEVKAYAEEAKNTTAPFMKKPSTIDPDELRTKMQGYFDTLQKLSDYEKIYEEYKPIYGVTKNAESL